MRIRRVTYDLGNVIERQEYLDGRYGAPGEKRAKKKKATPEEVEQVKWKREEWRRPHGKEIKNKELWQELSEQMEKHCVTLEFSESTRYSDRLQSKMR